jgi:hypothetical protein
MYRRFVADGSLAHRPPTEDELTAGLAAAGAAAADAAPAPSLAAAAAARARLAFRRSFAVAPDVDALEDDPEIQAFASAIRWRFTKSRNGVRGQFVQLNRWPSYVVSRCREDWGWVLESGWVRYQSCGPETVGLGDQWLGGDVEEGSDADEDVGTEEGDDDGE